MPFIIQLLTVAAWFLFMYGNYRFITTEVRNNRANNKQMGSLPRRCLCVLLGPFFWAWLFFGVMYLEIRDYIDYRREEYRKKNPTGIGKIRRQSFLNG